MIVNLPGVRDPRAARAAITDIFFRSSVRQSFESDEARARFLATWTGWYLSEGAADVWLSLDDAGTVIGYLTGCRDSRAARPLFTTVPRYDAFADLFDRFPAHLHVNVHPDHRNGGIGAALVEHFAAVCGTGVHVVTGAGARNAAFYRRHGFTEAVERGGLLFLGRPA